MRDGGLSFARRRIPSKPDGPALASLRCMQAQYALTRAEYERELDAAIAGSFPASDPPPWTLGASPWMATIPKAGSAAAVTEVIVDNGHRIGGMRLAALGEAIAMTSMLPLAIAIASASVAGLVWAVSWLI